MLPEKFFCLCLQNRKKLAYKKNEILVLIWATSATDMFTIHRIKNSFCVYVKHVLLDISVKGQFESKKWNVYYSSNQKLFLSFEKGFSLHFCKKRISKKIISMSVTIIVYKHNLKPLSFFDVIFQWSHYTSCGW